jgi:hypothetical protein
VNCKRHKSTRHSTISLNLYIRDKWPVSTSLRTLNFDASLSEWKTSQYIYRRCFFTGCFSSHSVQVEFQEILIGAVLRAFAKTLQAGKKCFRQVFRFLLWFFNQSSTVLYKEKVNKNNSIFHFKYKIVF